MKCFCTIINSKYLPFAFALHDSLIQFNPFITLHVLITDKEYNFPEPNSNTIHLDRLDFLSDNYLTNSLLSKYSKSDDKLRWAIKPVYISHLLQSFNKVIYIDADIHFFSNPNFLFDELEGHSMLLSPHWGNTDPTGGENFLLNFRIGLYNAGFIGASQNAQSSLEWWANACLKDITKNSVEGLFDDQRYLDLIPIIDENTQIVRHRGCNVGSWNMESNKRSLQGGILKINGIYPVVFIHFNKETIRQILNRNDELLAPYLESYRQSLEVHGLNLFHLYSELPNRKYDSILYILKHNFRLRTRLKRWLFKLAEKL